MAGSPVERVETDNAIDPNLLQLETCSIDLRTRTVRGRGEELVLSELEVKLLQFLAAHPRQDLERDQLIEGVWGVHVVPRAVDMTVRRLRLKVEADPSTPRHIHAVRGVGYRFEPLEETAQESARVHRIARPTDAFVGRLAVAESIRTAVAQRRALSITGPPGVGKTRVVRQVLAESERAVVWVALREARSESDVVRALVRALDLELMGAEHEAERVANSLAALDAVLVLDGADRCRLHLSPMLGVLGTQAPNVTMLVTSREPVGEFEALAVAPLAVPEGVALLEARSSRWGEVPTAAFEALVERLDGLPLALELAAARFGVLRPDQLLERIGGTLEIIDRQDGGRPLHAAVQLSWELLDEAERRVLAELASIPGPFDLAIAEQVVPDGDVLLVLEGLLDRSVVLVDHHTFLRFRVLEIVRDFAQVELPELFAAGENRFETALLDRAEQWAGQLHERGGPEARRALLAHEGHLFAVAGGEDVERAARALLCLGPLIETRGPFDGFLALGDQVLSKQLPVGMRAQVERWQGELCRRAQRFDRAEAHLETAVELAREAGDFRTEGRTLTNLGAVRMRQGRLEAATELTEQGLDKLGADSWLGAIVLGQLGLLKKRSGATDEARALYLRALAQHRAIGNRPYEGLVLGLLGTLHLHCGEAEQAVAASREALAVHREVGSKWAEGLAAGNLALALGRTGAADEAIASCRAALSIAEALGDRAGVAINRGNLGEFLRDAGQLEEAERMLRGSIEEHRRQGNARSAANATHGLATVLHRRGDSAGALLELDAIASQVEAGSALDCACAQLRQLIDTQ